MALVAFALLVLTFSLARLRTLELRRATRPDEPARWWLGYARDVTNLLAFGVTMLGLAVIGYPLRFALLGSFCLTLLIYIVDYAFGRWLRIDGARLFTLLFAAAPAALLTCRQGRVIAAFEALLAWLF